MHSLVNKLQEENSIMGKSLINLEGADEKIGTYEKEIYCLSKDLEESEKERKIK